MDTIIETHEKLDRLYQEYKDNKYQLNGTKTKEVAGLLVEMTLVKEADPADIALQLSRFSADLTSMYFDALTKDGAVSLENLDTVLKAFLMSDKDAKKSQHYVQKFVFAVSAVMKNHKEKALQSTQLPRLVAFISKFAVKAGKNKEKFQKLVNTTSGAVYLLDYSSVNQNSLTNIWNVTKVLYPDLSKAKYESFITEWASKYGFMATSEYQAVEQKQEISDKAAPAASEAADTTPQPAFVTALVEAVTKALSGQTDTFLSAIEKAIMPLRSAVASIQTELQQDRETLTAKTIKLEQELSTLKQQLQETDASLHTLRSEKDALAEKAAKLETLNAALNEKLKEAYTINSREASLEAQKVRSDLSKAFAFLYEDWLEYETSDVSEDNYVSLQAIIKKSFRALDRNGINFKGNQE